MGNGPLSVWGSIGGRLQGIQVIEQTRRDEGTSDLALVDTSLQWALGFIVTVSKVRGDSKAWAGSA